MKRILVLSDSHSGLSFMRFAIRAVKPDAVVHLGDYYDDGESMAQENRHILFHQVPGNCDRSRFIGMKPEVLCYPVCGVKLFMTHGHVQNVKFGIGRLLNDARKAGAQAALYGHTHIADCFREEDGMWVLNPGSCGSSGGSVGLIETENNEILSCKILRREELEAMK